MMTQRKMDNNLYKYLWSKYIDGDFRFETISPKEILDKYNFNISKEDLKERAGSLRQIMVVFYAKSQINDDSFNNMLEFEKARKHLISDFDKSKYSKMNKKELSSLIYLFKGEDQTEIIKGENFIENVTERLAVYFYFLSRYLD